MPPGTIAQLAQVPLFASLEAESLAALASAVKRRDYKDRERIVVQGNAGGSLFLIISGFVKVTTVSVDGKEMLLSFMGPGEFFGELSVLDGERRSASVTAIGFVTLGVIEQDSLFALIQASPGFSIEILKALCKRVRSLTVRVEELSSLPIPVRLAHSLVSLGERHGTRVGNAVTIPLRLTQEELGTFIGATRESVNKLLGTWDEQGMVRLENGRLTILDVEALKLLVQNYQPERRARAG